VAYTFYNNYHYYCTREQALTADIYVVDPDGVAELRENMGDELNIVVVYIAVDTIGRIVRMVQRGDSEEDIRKRITVDQEKFSKEAWSRALPNPEEDIYWVANRDLEETVNAVFDIIQKELGGEK